MRSLGVCGRFVHHTDPREFAFAMGIREVCCDLPPRYNVAPRQPIAVVVEDGVRRIVPMQWGLIPSWAKDDKIANKLINARAETIAEKPSFKRAFAQRRCLILADGFYEWKSDESGKHPVYITLKSGKPFCFGGIFEHWTNPQGERVVTCCIITTEASEEMRWVHHRMPLIVPTQFQERWLDQTITDPEALKDVLRPFSSEPLSFRRVSSRVNKAGYDSPDCILPE